MQKAEKNLIESNPVRLAICLNFSLYKYEQRQNEEEKKEAIDLAEKAADLG